MENILESKLSYKEKIRINQHDKTIEIIRRDEEEIMSAVCILAIPEKITIHDASPDGRTFTIKWITTNGRKYTTGLNKYGTTLSYLTDLLREWGLVVKNSRLEDVLAALINLYECEGLVEVKTINNTQRNYIR